ncbi:MAG: hypothetical protein QE271_07680 [Bacteriovoracaceae bacterium]|nr:hypothetical protein [Bacteriovoracaceae bacterium]
MKKILIGLLSLGSLSVLATNSCRFDTWWIPRDDQGSVRSAKITFKDSFSEERCRDEASKGQKSEFIILMTEPGAHVVKTKYTYKSDGNKASGVFKHGVWK